MVDWFLVDGDQRFRSQHQNVDHVHHRADTIRNVDEDEHWVGRGRAGFDSGSETEDLGRQKKEEKKQGPCFLEKLGFVNEKESEVGGLVVGEGSSTGCCEGHGPCCCVAGLAGQKKRRENEVTFVLNFFLW